MPTSKDSDNGSPAGRQEMPADPRSQPTEAVEAMESANDTSAHDDEEAERAEDVTSNPDTDELEELPGPSGDAPNESTG